MADVTGRPAYLQVADDLRAKIASDAIPVGAAIPSTQQLTEQYQVSTTVTRAAINELRNEGLVIGQPGKGIFVVRKPGPSAQDATAAALDAITTRLDAMADAIHSLEQRLEHLEPHPQSR